MIECRLISKQFGRGRATQVALDSVSLSLTRGETVALLGPSGSGKTTLLSILGCLISPTSGELRIDGKAINHLSKGRMLGIRRKYIGFVFQNAQLLPFLSVHENLRIAGRNVGIARTALSRRIDDLLQRLSIGELSHKRPEQLSGGERQRVAVARAVLHKPPLLLADEPTASLDWTNGQNVMLLLLEEARSVNSLLVTVTHDTRLTSMFDRTLQMDSGRIIPA